MAQRGLTLNNTKPQFKINPVIEGPWLDPPKEQDSEIGNWPDNTVFPKGSNPYPKDMPSSLRPPNRPAYLQTAIASNGHRNTAAHSPIFL